MMIECIQVTAGYGEKNVLNQFSFHFPQTGRFAITGVSGSGKTTLLRVLQKELPVFSGTVRHDALCQISCVYQEDRLLPWLSAYKNVALVSNEETARKALTEMEIEKMDTALSELSGGMKRRVSLARAYAYGGNTLLMDEPFKGLDDRLKNKIADMFMQKFSLIIFSTHDEEDIRRFCAEKIILS